MQISLVYISVYIYRITVFKANIDQNIGLEYLKLQEYQNTFVTELLI